MYQLLKWFRFYSLPILSAVLAVTSFIPFSPWAIFFCYTPLWFFALKQKKLKTLLIGGWTCQFLMTLGGFNWLIYTINEFGGFAWPLSILFFLGFCVFANLHVPLALALWFFSNKYLFKTEELSTNSILSYLLLPVYFALCMEYYPMIFDWHFGYTWFYAGFPAAQTAEVWGFSFINTLILFSSLLFLFTLKNFYLKKLFVLSFLWLVCFFGLHFWGKYLQNRWPEADSTARVLVVQPGSENKAKLQKKYKKDVRPILMDNLIKETKKHFIKKTDLVKDEIDFILWPESAFPYFIDLKGSTGRSLVQKWTNRFNKPLALSATHVHESSVTNSFFIFDKDGTLIQSPYNKMVLIAFGEYLPGESWLPMGNWLSYYNSSFQRGSGEGKVQTLNGLRLGIQICYEGLFDQLTRDLSNEGAHILINVTNDSWYGEWQEPWQHLYMTLARAIEVRRPMIRSTLTGLSAVISAKGHIYYISKMNQPDSWIQEVPYMKNIVKHHTVFTSWGFYINKTFLWIIVVFSLLYWLKNYVLLS